MTVGDRIKKMRTDKGMTQEELAKYIDSTKQNIYKYENNIVTNIPSDKIEKIASALQATPTYLMGWDQIDEDCDFSTNLIDTHYRSLMNWSEDKLLKKHEVAIMRGHMADLFLRYKQLIEKYVYAQRSWDRDNESFSKFYKEKDAPLSDEEIKELFLKQELQKGIENLTNWVNALPYWVTREEQKYLKDLELLKHNHLTPIAAHNDNESEEQIELMKQDLDEL
ncbi:helix-turn-helix domain-containing protein [Alkalibaculum sporogenes]|uniref:helix-turn-helix domain-containing protein n=1 Tax=Alkalibaculum sporogenes TaxID=2655001 RepID=UPI001FE781CB|nr:helix-turn-helix transcriptional regulator [Alkalibaculum sporogenes]